MNDLSADARALIAQTKTLDDPSAADRARVRQKLATAWAAQNAAAGTPSKFEDDVLSPGTDSRWLWATLTTTAVGMVLGLWFVMHPVTFPAPEQSSPPDAPNGTISESNPAAATLQEPNAPAVIAHTSEAAFARDPEVASAAQAAEPVRRSIKARAQANPRVRKRAPAISDANALDDIVDPEPEPEALVRTKPQPDFTSPQPSAASSAQRLPAIATARETDSARSAPAARDNSAAARARANGASKPVDADDIAPPQTGPKFVAQPIDDELALLGAAQEALQDHQPSLALRLVQHHGFRFPRGALAQERVAVQTLALCALHRPAEARQVLAELARRAPNSPLVAKLRTSCGFEAAEGSGN